MATGVGPAHTGALHAALNDVIGGGLDGAGADREAVEAEGGVVHAVDAGGEVGAFDATGLGGLRGRRLETIEGVEHGERAEGEQFALACVDPGGGCGRVGETGCGNGGEMLGGMIEVTDLDPLVAVLVGEVPDPDRAIGQDRSWTQDGEAPAGDAALPPIDLQGTPSGSLGGDARSEGRRRLPRRDVAWVATSRSPSQPATIPILTSCQPSRNWIMAPSASSTSRPGAGSSSSAGSRVRWVCRIASASAARIAVPTRTHSRRIVSGATASPVNSSSSSAASR